MEQVREGQQPQSNVAKVKVDLTEFKKHTSHLVTIAKNASEEEDRLIHFFCIANQMIVYSSDGAREARVILDIEGDTQTSFSIKADLISAIVSNTKKLEFEIEGQNLKVIKDTADIVMYRQPAKIENIKFEKPTDIVDIKVFTKTLKLLVKYLTKEDSINGVIVFSKRYVYTQSRLFYAIGEVGLNGNYIFDKMTITQILNVFSGLEGELEIYLTDKNSRIVMKRGNVLMRLPVLRHEEVDLKKFMDIPRDVMYVSQRNDFVNTLKMINALETCTEIDITNDKKNIIIRPANDSKSVYRIEQHTVTSYEGQEVPPLNITCNLKALTSLTSAIQNSTFSICPNRNNMMIISALGDVIDINYYMMVI